MQFLRSVEVPDHVDGDPDHQIRNDSDSSFLYLLLTVLSIGIDKSLQDTGTGTVNKMFYKSFLLSDFFYTVPVGLNIMICIRILKKKLKVSGFGTLPHKMSLVKLEDF